MTTSVHYRSLVADSARWEGFEFRDGDIVLSTPPKCGTTWTQMIMALLVFKTTEFDRPLDVISPWLDMNTRNRDEVFADLAGQSHRRFIKSHTPLDGLPFDDRVTYVTVGRDPRDVAISMAHHFDNLDLPAFLTLIDSAVKLETLADVMPTEMKPPAPDPRDRFWEWVDDPTPPEQQSSGLNGTIHHLATFFDVRDRPNVFLLHYGEMKDDLCGQMRRLATYLGIDIAEADLARLSEAATFERMRESATTVAPNTTEPIWLDPAGFFHKGTNGQWRDILDESDLERYEERVAQVASPELSEWVHRGSI